MQINAMFFRILEFVNILFLLRTKILKISSNYWPHFLCFPKFSRPILHQVTCWWSKGCQFNFRILKFHVSTSEEASIRDREHFTFTILHNKIRCICSLCYTILNTTVFGKQGSSQSLKHHFFARHFGLLQHSFTWQLKVKSRIPVLKHKSLRHARIQKTKKPKAALCFIGV